MATFKLGVPRERYFEQIYKEFGKTEKDVEEYADILMKWAESQPHFPEVPTNYGIYFPIVSCKFSIERAKQKLDMYYTIRRLMPEIYCTHPLSPELIHHNKVLYCFALPKLTNTLHRVFYIQLNQDYCPDDFKHEFLLVQLTHLIEVILQEDNCLNFQTIVNCHGMKLGHLSKFSPIVAKKMAVCLEKVYANRIAAIYIVNFVSFFETILNNMIIPLLPAKIRNRVKISKGMDILYESLDKSILPKELGGEERPVAELQEMMMRKYEEWKDRFDKIQYIKADESLRPEKLENDDILGYYGSFKKISVD